MAKYAASEQTSEALLTAAGELGGELGFANVSTRAVAQRAGVNVSSIHYHFGGKEQLFEGVVRRIIEHMHSCPLEGFMEPLRPRLASRKGQVEAVRAMVRHHMQAIFHPDKPAWYPKVVYQVMQYDTPLRELVNSECIEPENEAYFEVLEAIDPGMSHEEKVLHRGMLIAPLLFHSNYAAPVLRNLGAEQYPRDYLAMLEETTLRQALAVLGLSEATWESEEERER